MTYKILVIDDDPTLVKLVQSRLEANNYQVVTALDGEEGLKKFKTEKPHLIILDIKMPKMDGYTFLLEFKKIADLKTTPVIILTAYEEMRDIFKVEGVNDYLVKPLNMEALLQKIVKHLESISKKILVIDDESDHLQLLESGLRAYNYDVITAVDGMEGLEKARKEVPDLIVLDIMMPKINGYSVCRLLKYDDKYKSIPIIILSARKQEADLEIGRQVGADAYITKPYEREALLEKLKQLLWD